VKSVWLLLITSGKHKGEFREGAGDHYTKDTFETPVPFLAFGARKHAMQWIQVDASHYTMRPVRFDVAKRKRKRGGK
jgi:hypothetical protein